MQIQSTCTRVVKGGIGSYRGYRRYSVKFRYIRYSSSMSYGIGIHADLPKDECSHIIDIQSMRRGHSKERTVGDCRAMLQKVILVTCHRPTLNSRHANEPLQNDHIEGRDQVSVFLLPSLLLPATQSKSYTLTTPRQTVQYLQ
jgi:hypothetical protein